MSFAVFDARPCELGEGAFWHPERGQFFWCDILAGQLMSRDGEAELAWDLGRAVSAIGWVDPGALVLATETGLVRFDIDAGTEAPLAELPGADPGLRTNDGRADPWGGFWFSTMGKRAEPGRGAIHRYYRGELRTVVSPMTIPNAISFPPDRGHAHFADTATGRVHRVALREADGWPDGSPELWLDLTGEGLHPDGAVFDAEGNFWNAQWGAHRVAAYDGDGRFLRALRLPPAHVSCPAFGGEGLTSLLVTTARENLEPDRLEREPFHGKTYLAENVATGLPEPKVLP